MNLEEFRKKMRPLSHYSKSELINAAWKEATKAEREACAKRWEESHGFDKHGVAEWLRSNK